MIQKVGNGKGKILAKDLIALVRGRGRLCFNFVPRWKLLCRLALEWVEYNLMEIYK